MGSHHSIIDCVPIELSQRILELSFGAFYTEEQGRPESARLTNSIDIRRQNAEAYGIPLPPGFDDLVSSFDESLSQNADLCIGFIRIIQERRQTLNLISSNIHLVKKKGEGASWAKEEINGTLYLVISLCAPFNGGARKVVLRWRDITFAKLKPGCIYEQGAKELEGAIAREAEKVKGKVKGREFWTDGMLTVDVLEILVGWIKSPETIIKIEGCDPQLVERRKSALRDFKAAPLILKVAFVRRVLDKWIKHSTVPITLPVRGTADRANKFIIHIKLGVWWLLGAIPMPLCIMRIGDNRLLTAAAVMAHVERCRQLFQRFHNLPLDEASRGRLIDHLKQLPPVSGAEPLMLALEKSIREDTHFQTLVAVLCYHRDNFLRHVYSELSRIRP